PCAPRSGRRAGGGARRAVDRPGTRRLAPRRASRSESRSRPADRRSPAARNRHARQRTTWPSIPPAMGGADRDAWAPRQRHARGVSKCCATANAARSRSRKTEIVRLPDDRPNSGRTPDELDEARPALAEDEAAKDVKLVAEVRAWLTRHQRAVFVN